MIIVIIERVFIKLTNFLDQNGELFIRCDTSLKIIILFKQIIIIIDPEYLVVGVIVDYP